MAEGPIKVYKDRVEISTLSTTTKLTINGTVEGLDASKIGAAPADNVKKVYFTVAASGATSINFSGTTNAMIYCRGSQGNLAGTFNYSGYGVGSSRQSLTAIVNYGGMSVGLNDEANGQGMSIVNNTVNTIDVCVEVMRGNIPTIGTTNLSSNVSNTGSFAAASHTHNYLPLSGGELTGNLTIKGTTGNTWIRALNDYSTIYLEAASSGTRGIWDSGKDAWIVSVDTNNNVSLNGNAATASKLNTDAGSTTKPVYFSGGIPKECGASLAVSITGSSASCTGNANSATTATTANKVSKALTINSTSYDGSAAVTITVPTFSYNSTTKTLTITG